MHGSDSRAVAAADDPLPRWVRVEPPFTSAHQPTSPTLLIALLTTLLTHPTPYHHYIVIKTVFYYICVPLNRQTWERNIMEAWDRRRAIIHYEDNVVLDHKKYEKYEKTAIVTGTSPGEGDIRFALGVVPTPSQTTQWITGVGRPAVLAAERKNDPTFLNPRNESAQPYDVTKPKVRAGGGPKRAC